MVVLCLLFALFAGGAYVVSIIPDNWWPIFGLIALLLGMWMACCFMMEGFVGEPEVSREQEDPDLDSLISIPEGWKCPECKTIHAPWVACCDCVTELTATCGWCGAPVNRSGVGRHNRRCKYWGHGATDDPIPLSPPAPFEPGDTTDGGVSAPSDDLEEANKDAANLFENIDKSFEGPSPKPLETKSVRGISGIPPSDRREEPDNED